ncbi:MAG: squalene--hopene cyclase [Candidatus Eremiobacteraeota bacterium]|nr:squalene--hopene cyclase [Candidatus Eremiobacteraeota bacterium]
MRWRPLALRKELDAATSWLLERQHPDGWWTDELETNVTMTAEHVLLLSFLGLPLHDIREGACEHLLRAQREDGSWALYHEGPADVSTTIEAYVALKVLGVDPASTPMRSALLIIQRLGGIAAARVFTKIWLALFGACPWSGIPTMPPELVYLPAQIPLNLYDFACWARGTIAPLTIVISRRPVRPLGVDVSEIVVPGTHGELSRVPGTGIFWWLDKLLKLYEQMPVKVGRSQARARMARWIVERQEADGSWGGIQPPWVYSLIALNLEGMDVSHPVMRKGLEGMRRFALHDDASGWRFQACMSPVWDTAWAVRALRRAGVMPSHPAMQSAVEWLLAEQITGGGDWQVRCKNVPCGGWAFEFDNDIYPDIDDTAVVVLALLEGGQPERVTPAVDRAIAWVRAMRSRDGAWAAFDRDNTNFMAYAIPFADFGAMIDPPTEDVTAHVLEMLGARGAGAHDPDVAGGLAYLRRTQTGAGSWYGRWGVNHIYGTWCVLDALKALGGGLDMQQRAACWLIAAQNADGGWGETCLSYEDASFAGVGTSAASQTAWAVLGLQSAGAGNHSACARGLAFLCEHQRDGTWPEPDHTGTGFPGDFYINYHLYRHLFPMMALAGAQPRVPGVAVEQTSRIPVQAK